MQGYTPHNKINSNFCDIVSNLMKSEIQRSENHFFASQKQKQFDEKTIQNRGQKIVEGKCLFCKQMVRQMSMVEAELIEIQRKLQEKEVQLLQQLHKKEEIINKLTKQITKHTQIKTVMQIGTLCEPLVKFSSKQLGDHSAGKVFSEWMTTLKTEQSEESTFFTKQGSFLFDDVNGQVENVNLNTPLEQMTAKLKFQNCTLRNYTTSLLGEIERLKRRRYLNVSC